MGDRVKYASAGNAPDYWRILGHDWLVAMPNQRSAMRHWREALQIVIKPRGWSGATALEAKRRYGSAAASGLVSNGGLRKFLPVTPTKWAVANGRKI
jgi:hypothetical protein